MKYRKRPEHNGDNYLKAILESIVEYNAVARLDMAKLLHVGYKQAIQHPTKHASETLVLEILSKWMQVLEDLSVLLMMFEKPYTSDQRWELYLKYSNQQILEFLHRTRKGLSKEATRRIFGLKSANEYYKEGQIKKAEITYFKHTIDVEVASHQKTLASIAKAYAGNKRRGKNSIEPSILLDIYFKTKHGFKVIHQTPTAKQIWTLDSNGMHMLTHIKKWPWGRKMLPLTTFDKFKEEHVDMLVNRIDEWSNLMAKIAEIQLKNINNAYWLVVEIRLLKTKELLNSVKKPTRNEECLCGSEMKFKKCCEPRLSSD